MARQLEYDETNHRSSTFVPQTTFIVMGSVIETGDTYQVECQPTNLATNSTWTQVRGSEDLTGTEPMTGVNGSPGFRYRVNRTAGSGARTGTIFYWDHVTSLRSIYN